MKNYTPYPSKNYKFKFFATVNSSPYEYNDLLLLSGCTLSSGDLRIIYGFLLN